MMLRRCGFTISLLASVAVIAGVVVVSFRDEVRNRVPWPSPEAAEKMTLPRGYKAIRSQESRMFTSRSPSRSTPKGRLWVVEGYSYPVWFGGPRGRTASSSWKTPMAMAGPIGGRSSTKGTSFTGIALGFGGVWLCAPRELALHPGRRRQ